MKPWSLFLITRHLFALPPVPQNKKYLHLQVFPTVIIWCTYLTNLQAGQQSDWRENTLPPTFIHFMKKSALMPLHFLHPPSTHTSFASENRRLGGEATYVGHRVRRQMIKTKMWVTLQMTPDLWALANHQSLLDTGAGDWKVCTFHYVRT